MDKEHVQAKLIEVLKEIQSDSGYAETAITSTSCPVNDLEGFDSIIWLDAIGMLEICLEVSIPNEKNIFLSSDDQRPLTVEESAIMVCECLQDGEA